MSALIQVIFFGGRRTPTNPYLQKIALQRTIILGEGPSEARPHCTHLGRGASQKTAEFSVHSTFRKGPHCDRMSSLEVTITYISISFLKAFPKAVLEAFSGNAFRSDVEMMSRWCQKHHFSTEFLKAFPKAFLQAFPGSAFRNDVGIESNAHLT